MRIILALVLLQVLILVNRESQGGIENNEASASEGIMEFDGDTAMFEVYTYDEGLIVSTKAEVSKEQEFVLGS